MYVIVKDENGTRQFWAGDHWQREYGIVKYESQADAFAVASTNRRVRDGWTAIYRDYGTKAEKRVLLHTTHPFTVRGDMTGDKCQYDWPNGDEVSEDCGLPRSAHVR